MAKGKKYDDNESALTTFYYNNKLLIWILIFVVLLILILKYCVGNRKEVINPSNDIVLKIENKDNLTVGIGNTIKIKASVNVDNANINWSSSDTNIARVINGNVTGVNYGRVTIYASYIDGDGNKYIDNCVVEVAEGNKDAILNSVSFPEGDLYMPINRDYAINLILNPSNALISEKRFVSSNDSIVSVTNDGVIKSHKTGHARVTASVNGKFQTTIDVYVGDYAKPEIVLSPTSINFDTDSRKIKVGSSEKLYYSIVPSNADRTKLTWSSDDTSVVTVDKDGKIKGISEGETIVTVSSINGQRADIIIEVYDDIVPVQDIVVTSTTLNMEAGKTLTISPTIKPSNASNKGLSYSSLDPSIVSVSANGLGSSATLSALKKGSTTVIIRSGNIERKITVNVKGGNNNSEIDENDVTLPTTIKVRSNKNNLAKTYNEAKEIPVSGPSIITITLSMGVGKIKYCYNKYGNTLCTPDKESYVDTTVAIPSGDIYVLRIIKYDYSGNEISSASTNYSNGVLNYYINTKSPSNTKLYTITGAYDSSSLATISPSKIGNKVTIRVNDSNRYLNICYANGRSCAPSTKVTSIYTITINSYGTTRIYVNEFDKDGNKIGNTEVYYVYVKEEENEKTIDDDTGNKLNVSELNVYNQTLIGKYLTATVQSDPSFNETRFCYTTVNKGANGTCNLDFKSTTVEAHNGASYFHPKLAEKTYYATFTATNKKVFWFDIDGLDKLYDTSDTNKDVIFEFAVKSTKGYSEPIRIRINMIERSGSNSTWQSTFIK